VLRKGATGKNLEPAQPLEPGRRPTRTARKARAARSSSATARLEKIIAFGTDGGMVNYDDILTKEEINLMARYIQNTPDVPPEFSLKDMKDSWKLIVPVKDRPTKQMNKINLEERLRHHPARHRRSWR
jgi:nitrite reductase (NO-forming)/hydroxylamine reductase